MKSDMDNREWLDDYESLKRIDAKNPFLIPTGYFDELAQHITSRIRLEELKNSSTGFSVPENYFDQLSSNIQSRIRVEDAVNIQDSGFTVPENYFDELGSNIQSRITIEEALNPEHQGFSVPENYFDELNSNIQSRIAIEQHINSEAESFTVPENYFETLSSNIQSRIAVEQHINSEAESFTVPENYFEQLNQNILNKTVNENEVVTAKSFTLPVAVKKKGIVRRMFSSQTFRYATAACFALILGIGVVIRNGDSPVKHDHSFLHEQLSTVPVDEIKSYLQLHADASDTRTLMDGGQQINSANLDEDLSDYLDTTN
ncbi:hypothetical protein [Mucilaginibacter lappiensis]|uniref:DNA-binding transcriptional regulator/RsmH inhibitor MraZ n=1 Tax=Mucilaginibacter lappiensis TaxID=354630 RepID=A0A841JD09_9SPHI|nr:hypothetical protein [Mucilaginibacter lappiensis]MBB6128232.1 DNA-binding transcriptional regulator/RsmH inhibitor MraZ [Mucilaginibacter lappiensis]